MSTLESSEDWRRVRRRLAHLPEQAETPRGQDCRYNYVYGRIPRRSYPFERLCPEGEGGVVWVESRQTGNDCCALQGGGLPKHDGTDDIIIRVHLDSIPESILTGRRPETSRTPNRPTGGATGMMETRPNRASAQYVNKPSAKPVTPGPKPKKSSTTTKPPTSAPNCSATLRGGASRFPQSDPILDEVLNNQSIMEHLNAFKITNEELKISRRVINGELNLDIATVQLQELFQRLPSGPRLSGGPAGGQPH
jgi:hypothetical protein